MGANKPETQRVYYRKWRFENREKYLAGKRDHYQRNKEKSLHTNWVNRLQRDFGISEDDYLDMLESQNGVCAICLLPERTKRQGTLKRLCVDHDHSTGEVRGLLCQRCNLAIGYLEDSPERLQRAVEYLI